MPIAQQYLTKTYISTSSPPSIENSEYPQIQQPQQHSFFERSQNQQQQQPILQSHLNSQMYHQSPQYFQNNYYYQNHLQNQYQMQVQQNQRYLNQIVNNTTDGVNKLGNPMNIMPNSTMYNAYQNDTLTNFTSISSVSVSTASALTITSSSGLASSSSSTSSHQGSNNSFEQVCLIIYL